MSVNLIPSFLKKNMEKIFYFAYGSNLFQERLEYRIGKVINKGVYTLNNFKLVFNCNFSKGKNSEAFANIVFNRGESVEGFLYEITPLQLKELSRYEGLYACNFLKIDDGILAVYIADETTAEIFNSRPNLNYLNLIIDGCIEKELYATAEMLINYKKQNYKLKSIKKYKL